MKIYTKTGDDGKTSLFDNSRVWKSHERIIAYGTVDELNSAIGLAISMDLDRQIKEILIRIQNDLFNLASLIANDGGVEKTKMLTIDENSVKMLELAIDNMDSKLPALREFILPSGNKIYSLCHITRTVCRRVERNLVALSQENDCLPYYLQYLNRLSDFLFVLSRAILAEKGASERPWEKNH